jgi:hypothetical protein
VRRPHHVLLGSLLCLLAAACGVGSEDIPQPITDTVSSDNGPTPSVDNSPDSSAPSLTSTTTTTTTTTSPTRPPRVPKKSPPHSTEPSVTR